MKNIEEINSALEGQINAHLSNNQNYSNEDIKELKTKKDNDFNKLIKEQNNEYKTTNFNFLEIAEASREMTDLDCGIITTTKKNSDIPIVGSKDSATAGITIRDGRFKDQFTVAGYETKTHPSESKYPWIAQMAITAKGVVDLFELSNSEYNKNNEENKNNKENKDKISDFFKQHLEAIDKATTPEEYRKITLNFNNELKNYLKEQKLQISSTTGLVINNTQPTSFPITLKSDKEIIKAIDTARHFAPLDLEHTHNITISKAQEGSDQEIIQTNLIVNSNAGTKGYNDKSKHPDWYNNLSTVARNFIDKLQDNKVVSSRIKNLTGYPGNANAYMEFNHTNKIGVRDGLKPIGKPNFRTGALANHKGGNSLENAKGAIQDIIDIDEGINNSKDSTKSNGIVILNLNNSVFFDRKEKKIRDNTERASENLNEEQKGNNNPYKVEYKNVAINGSSILSYIGLDNKEKKLEEIIKIIEDAKSAGKTLLIQCKSGKDRTGYAQIVKCAVDYVNSDSYSLNDSKATDDSKTTEKNSLQKIKTKNLLEQFNKDHVQEYQAGGVGGSVGINAIKNGGLIATWGKKFFETIGLGNVFKTNKLDKLNNFKCEDYSNEVKEILARESIKSQEQNNLKPQDQGAQAKQLVQGSRIAISGKQQVQSSQFNSPPTSPKLSNRLSQQSQSQ